MKKIILGGIVGGIIIYVWSILAWTVFPLHQPTLHKIPNEDAVIGALQSNLPENAMYMFPAKPGMSGDQAAKDAWAQKMRRGPTGLIAYNPTGSDPMMTNQMVVGIILDLLSAGLVAWFLSRSTALGSSYLSRIAFCCMFGIFLSLSTHLINWNWMGFPSDFTHALILDSVITWFLAGLGIGAIVKSPKMTPA